MIDKIARWLLARFPRPIVILIMAMGLIVVCGFFILLFAIAIGILIVVCGFFILLFAIAIWILITKPIALVITVVVLLTSIAYVFIDEQLPKREKKDKD